MTTIALSRLCAGPRAFLLVVSMVGVAFGQAPAAVPSSAVRTHVKGERFDIVTSIRGLPLGVRDELQRMWRSQTLDIAEPGTAYQGTTSNDPTLPSRRLVAAGCSADHHCLVYYERAYGRADGRHAWVAALFHWSPAMTRFDGGGAAPGGLETIEDVRQAIGSGAVEPTERW